MYLEKRNTFQEYDARGEFNFHIKFVKSTALQKTLFELKYFNTLSDNIKTALSLKTFCKKLFILL